MTNVRKKGAEKPDKPSSVPRNLQRNPYQPFVKADIDWLEAKGFSRNQIDRAATSAWWYADSVNQPSPPRIYSTARHQLRAAEKKVHEIENSIEELANWMADSESIASRALGLVTNWNHFEWLETILERFGDLSAAVVVAKDGIPKPERGRPKNQAGRIFVWQLADLWIEATGELPRRRHNPSANPPHDYGPFNDFVHKAARLGNPSGSGIDDQIRQVVIDMGKNRRQRPKK